MRGGKRRKDEEKGSSRGEERRRGGEERGEGIGVHRYLNKTLSALGSPPIVQRRSDSCLCAVVLQTLADETSKCWHYKR